MKPTRNKTKLEALAEQYGMSPTEYVAATINREYRNVFGTEKKPQKPGECHSYQDYLDEWNEENGWYESAENEDNEKNPEPKPQKCDMKRILDGAGDVEDGTDEYDDTCFGWRCVAHDVNFLIDGTEEE